MIRPPAPKPMPELLRSRPLIGMVHLPPLPGSPGATLELEELIDFALDEADILEEVGMDGLIVEDAAADLAERGGVDAVIVSGARSPDPPSFERVAGVREAVDLPVLIGSGVTLANAADYHAASDGVLIGETDFKVGRVWGGRSDREAYAEASRRCRS